MFNNLTKKILDINDVLSIKANLDFLKLVPRAQAEQMEAVVFDGDKYKVLILTTNNYPDRLALLLHQWNDKKMLYDVFYTDDDAFKEAINWYIQLEAFEKIKQDEYQRKISAEDIVAEDLIKKMFADRVRIEEGNFIMEMIKLSYQTGASDLHFQTGHDGVVMRIRKDGVLKTLVVFSYEEFQKYFTKIKFISGVKMNVSFMPQDGRFDFEVTSGGTPRKIDVRVNFMPGLRGESIVMRFLDATKGLMSFEEIGFDNESAELLKHELTKNYGMILMTGPTGSGKTTTLYSMLTYINDASRKIITMEDPVEYELEGIQQSQISLPKGYTYEEGLKSVLRHDPDVIMVGEIRSLESAEMAMNAALTGHLVFSTLHTNNSIEAITRLLNMGIKPYMLVSALNVVIGQRLVRRLHSCKKPIAMSDVDKAELSEFLDVLKIQRPDLYTTFDGQLYEAVGCEGCGHDGYKGRIALKEMFQISPAVKKAILAGKSIQELFDLARKEGYLTLKEDGYVKVLQGITTLEEIRANI